MSGVLRVRWFYAMASAVPPTRAAAASGVAVRVGEEVKA